MSNLSLSNTTCNNDGDGDSNGVWSNVAPECVGKFAGFSNERETVFGFLI